MVWGGEGRGHILEINLGHVKTAEFTSHLKISRYCCAEMSDYIALAQTAYLGGSF